MDFADHRMRVEIDGQWHDVRVTGDALQFWWGADVGPQTAEGLIADHIGEIAARAAQKVAQQAVDADGSVTVSDEDFE